MKKKLMVILMTLMLNSCAYTLRIDGLERKGFPIGNTKYSKETIAKDGSWSKVMYNEDKKQSYTGIAAVVTAATVFMGF